MNSKTVLVVFSTLLSTFSLIEASPIPCVSCGGSSDLSQYQNPNGQTLMVQQDPYDPTLNGGQNSYGSPQYGSNQYQFEYQYDDQYKKDQSYQKAYKKQYAYQTPYGRGITGPPRPNGPRQRSSMPQQDPYNPPLNGPSNPYGSPQYGSNQFQYEYQYDDQYKKDQSYQKAYKHQYNLQTPYGRAINEQQYPNDRNLMAQPDPYQQPLNGGQNSYGSPQYGPNQYQFEYQYDDQYKKDQSYQNAYKKQYVYQTPYGRGIKGPQRPNGPRQRSLMPQQSLNGANPYGSPQYGSNQFEYEYQYDDQYKRDASYDKAYKYQYQTGYGRRVSNHNNNDPIVLMKDIPMNPRSDPKRLDISDIPLVPHHQVVYVKQPYYIVVDAQSGKPKSMGTSTETAGGAGGESTTAGEGATGASGESTTAGGESTTGGGESTTGGGESTTGGGESTTGGGESTTNSGGESTTAGEGSTTASADSTTSA